MSLPERVAFNLEAVVAGRRRGCVLVPELDVFVRPWRGRVQLEAERIGMDRATGRDLLPVLQHLKRLGYTIRRVYPKRRLRTDVILEVDHPRFRARREARRTLRTST